MALKEDIRNEFINYWKMAKKRDNLTIKKQIEFYKKAAEEGSIPDEQNPVSVLQTFSTELLLKIAMKELNMKSFAAHELKSRGLDKEGQWVGFPKAEAIWQAIEQIETKNRKQRSRL